MTLDVLVVCTGNTCRSPMAEVLLAAHLRRRGMTGAHVHSAGTLQWHGPANPSACDVMAEHGLDLSAHRSRTLTREMIDDADLVLAMTRDHAGGVLAHAPVAAARTFLLGEIVRLGRHVDARPSPVEWIAAVDAARPRGRPHGRATDEIADPIGQPVEVYRTAADRLDRLTSALADLLTRTGAGGRNGEREGP